MERKNKLARSVVILIVLSLLSKALGFVREMFMAQRFGAGFEIDTYLVALSSITLITMLMNETLNRTTIPVLAEIEADEGKRGKIEHVNNLLNIVILFSIGLVVLGILLAPLLIKILGRGFSLEQRELGVSLIRIGLPSIFFTGLLGVFSGLLQSENMFFESAVANFPLNFVMIGFLSIFAESFGIKGLMTAYVVANASMLLVMVHGIKKLGFSYSFKLDFKDRYIRKIVVLMAPIVIGVAAHEINVVVDRTLASKLVVGSISALGYASRINSLVIGIFISAITTVIFPMLAQSSMEDGYESLKRIMKYGFDIIIIITVPATVGLVVLANPIVQAVFERGAFDALATTMTSGALIFYALGIVSISMNGLITRVYYALHDTKTPMILGVFAVGVNIALNIILMQFMAHRGLALATSISSTASMLLMFFGLKKKIGSIGTLGYLRTFLKTTAASLVMGLVAVFTYKAIYGLVIGLSQANLLALLGSVLLAVLVYGLMCYMLRVRVFLELLGDLKKRFIKK